MSSFNNIFRNLNLSKKSQLCPIFRTGDNSIYYNLKDQEFDKRFLFFCQNFFLGELIRGFTEKHNEVTQVVI